MQLKRLVTKQNPDIPSYEYVFLRAARHDRHDEVCWIYLLMMQCSSVTWENINVSSDVVTCLPALPKVQVLS